MDRKGSAVWNGDFKNGSGTVSTESGAMKETQYGVGARFENEPGTNPEELIGAAHASCYSMALSLGLQNAGLTAERIETTSTVSLNKVEGGFAIDKIHLDVVASVPGASDAQFQEIAEATKVGCPVSKLLNASMTLSATLNS
ncbi:MAG: OsmC family protein [Fimbriimonadaceae bacterium]|nr:OsmC family protein [Fimbriimonadaceae bacterium]